MANERMVTAMRLIDADALDFCFPMPDDFNSTLKQIGIEMAKARVVNAPTIEAEPVKHGCWVHCNGKSNLWYCSECGEKIMYNPTRRTYNIAKKPVHEVNKRCRNCGAKMDGDGDA